MLSDAKSPAFRLPLTVVAAFAVGCGAAPAAAPPARTDLQAPLPAVDAGDGGPYTSLRVGPSCKAAGALSIATVEPGPVLVWNAAGTALAVARSEASRTSPLEAIARADRFGSVTVVDLASRKARRSEFRGSVAAVPKSDLFAITGDRTAVVGSDAQPIGDCVRKGRVARASTDGRAVALSAAEICVVQDKTLRAAARRPTDTGLDEFGFVGGSEQVYYVEDGQIRVWDAHTGASLPSWPPPGVILRAAQSPDGDRVAMLLADGTLWLWDPRHGKGTNLGKMPQGDVRLLSLRRGSGTNLGRAPQRDVQSLSLGASGNAVVLTGYRTATVVGTASRRVPALTAEGLVLARSADVAVGRETRPKGRGLVVWYPDRPIRRFAAHPGEPGATAWAVSDHGERLAVATESAVDIYDLASGGAERRVSMAAVVRALSFRPGMLDLAVATTDGIDLVREGAPAVERIADRLEDAPMWSAALSPSSRNLALHVGDKVLSLSLSSGTLSRALDAAGFKAGSGYTGVAWRDESLIGPQRTTRPTTVRLPQGLSVPRERDDDAAPELISVVWSRDSKRVLGLANIPVARATRFRVVEWDVEAGRQLWQTDLWAVVQKTVPTRAGWLLEESESVTRYEGGREVFRGPGPYAYDRETDRVAVVKERAVVLADAAGATTTLPLSFDEPVRRLSFDSAGARLALGTTRGLWISALPSRSTALHVDLGAVVEPFGWHDDVVVALETSSAAPEHAIVLVDVRSGAQLRLGFAVGRGDVLQSFAASSTGWIDADPALYPTLRAGDKHDALVPGECARAGVLRDWLGGDGSAP